MAYIPKRGDVVYINMSPQAGHEQAGVRPALVLSPEAYNKKVGLAILCPITKQVKGFPFEVAIPEKLAVSGVILSDQIRTVDWKARNVSFKCKLPKDTVDHVCKLIGALIEIDNI